jgi:hypothetical protein
VSDAAAILAKLRDASPEGAVARLAALLVDDAMGRTIGELVGVRAGAAALKDILRAFAANDAAEARVVRAVTEAEERIGVEKRPLGSFVPPALKMGARELAAVPLTPSRDVVMRLVDREPVRKLVRAQVTDTLVAFGRRAASPMADNPLARGLGGLGKLAMGQASKPGAFGALASAVSGEVERQVEKRAADFADTAVDGILSGLADQISDPSRAKEQAAVRQALIEGVLELTGAEVLALGRGPTASRVAVARRALAAWVADDSFERDVESFAGALLAQEAARTLGEVLAELGLRDVVAARAKELVLPRVAAVVGGEPFAQWLGSLVSG